MDNMETTQTKRLSLTKTDKSLMIIYLADISNDDQHFTNEPVVFFNLFSLSLSFFKKKIK